MTRIKICPVRLFLGLLAALLLGLMVGYANGIGIA